MKYFLFFFSFLFIFPFCSQDFEILEVTQQKWSGGMPDSGTGTDYVVKILAKNSREKLLIDQLWIGDDFYKVQAYRQDKNQRDTLFVKNDTIFIKATKLLQPDRKGAMLEKKSYQNLKKPFEYSGAALIGYELKGKRKYKEIATIEKLKFIPYP